MVEDQVFNKDDSLGHADVGEPYQPRVRSSMEMDEFTEILVHGDEDPVFGDGPFQECPVSGVWAEFSRVQGVVSLVLKPLCQPASCAAVHEEVHFYPTDTWARESPAMTAWA